MATTSQFFLLSPLKSKPSTNSTSLTPQFKTRRKRPNLFPLHISLRDQATTQTTNSSEQQPNQARKTSIWINPKRKLMNSPHLSQAYQDGRMARLTSLASSLDQSKPPDGTVSSILSAQTFPISEPDAVIVIDHMRRPDKAVVALRWFLKNIQIKNKLILYNVTFKVFRKSKDWDRTESLWSEMLQTGLKPDNITLTTIISCAKQCNLPSKAVEFYEKMPCLGLEPDKLSRGSIIGSYLQSGHSEKAFALYDQVRTEKGGYHVAFVTMIKAYARSGNFDGALNVFEEMKALEIQPNLITYNVLLDAMRQAGRPWQVKTIYTEMIKNNFRPDKTTYDTLIRAYTKGRYTKDALNAYNQMKEFGFQIDVMLYNALLSTCADVGLVEEAEQLFDEMKKLPEGSRPDSWTFSSMLTAYACSGRVPDAERVFNEMLDAGLKPNIFVFTSLVRCYGVSKRVNELEQAIGKFQELGIKPDDRFNACLLNVVTHNSTIEDFDKVVACISSVNLKLGDLVKLLVDVNSSDESIKERVSEWLESVFEPIRKPSLNCLMDICMNFGQMSKARLLLDLAIGLNIYDDLQEKFENMWVLNLKGLSVGGAKVALNAWTDDLKNTLAKGEKIPALLGVNTGHGNHKYGGKRVINDLKLSLREINAPFHESPDKIGWLFSTDVAVKDWLESETREEVAVAV